MKNKKHGDQIVFIRPIMEISQRIALTTAFGSAGFYHPEPTKDGDGF
jgi:hypothetical protein